MWSRICPNRTSASGNRARDPRPQQFQIGDDGDLQRQHRAVFRHHRQVGHAQPFAVQPHATGVDHLDRQHPLVPGGDGRLRHGGKNGVGGLRQGFFERQNPGPVHPHGEPALVLADRPDAVRHPIRDDRAAGGGANPGAVSGAGTVSGTGARNPRSSAGGSCPFAPAQSVAARRTISGGAGRVRTTADRGERTVTGRPDPRRRTLPVLSVGRGACGQPFRVAAGVPAIRGGGLH